jgi:hypothetical protein
VRLLVTTSHSILEVDSATGAITPVHRGLGLYFGIATDGERYFVAARGRMVSAEMPPEAERGRILVFDKALRLHAEVIPPIALRDMHEILWHRGKLWITCSFDNAVALHDAASGAWELWQPLGVPAQPPLDANHFNSLAVRDNRLFVMAHNRGPSELLAFQLPDRHLVIRTPLGEQAHNIRWRNGIPLTCSSAEGVLVAADGWRVPVGGFPRGLLFAGDETFVGISEIAERKDRDLSTGRVAVFDREWNRVREIALEREGLVLDIHPL